MAGVTSESTLAVAERILQVLLPEEERRELVGLLVVLAGIRLSPTTILDALRRNRMIDDLLEDNSLVQVMIERGIERGERRMAQTVLEARFGALSDDLVAALSAANEATLRALAAHIGTDSLADIRALLGLSA